MVAQPHQAIEDLIAFVERMHHRVTRLLTQSTHIPQAACRQLVKPLEAKEAQIEEQQGAFAQSL